MNALRQEMAQMLGETACRRPPALRRSLKDEWLYATDLPLAAGEEEAAAFRKRAEERGWLTGRDGAWIQMTRESPEPPENGFDGPYGREAVCCASLLRRHTPVADGTEERRIRTMLIKAGEEGAEAYEQACGRVHREWAVRLRKKKALPKVSIRFFGH